MNSFKPLARLAGSLAAVAVFGFAATVLYTQMPSATPLDAQDDPLQNTSMFVRRDHPASRHPLQAEGRQAQPEAVNLTNWHYTGRPIPSTFQIY